jgi:hypothetical protein
MAAMTRRDCRIANTQQNRLASIDQTRQGNPRQHPTRASHSATLEMDMTTTLANGNLVPGQCMVRWFNIGATGKEI